MTATALDPARPNVRAFTTIRRSFLYGPYVKYRHLLEKRKAEAGIDLIESSIPPMTLSGIDTYIDYLHKDGEWNRLRDFYHHKWYLRKSWDVKKAQVSAYDYGIDSIFQLAGGSNGNSRNHEMTRRVVFAIGLGSFNTRTGLPSKHSEFEKRFIIRARHQGYQVVGVHEYYTSAKCPRPTCNEFLQNTENRSKYCHGCRAYFDRDIVGSENIARKERLVKFSLTPVQEGNHHTFPGLGQPRSPSISSDHKDIEIHQADRELISGQVVIRQPGSNQFVGTRRHGTMAKREKVVKLFQDV
ncbi:hypothetical protein EDD11_002128 [Mortierella claussenii]|nr:hypothetical protein EDD11_002128 [Mortierella claussenii]